MINNAFDALSSLEVEEFEKYCKNIKVDGEIAQTVTLTLDHGQSLWCSKGSLLGHSDGVDWMLKVPGGASKSIGRVLSGEGATLTRITSQRSNGKVILTANQPGKLVTWDLSRGPIVCTSGSFLAALGDVNIEVTAARSAGAMFFGGAGLFMQRLSGKGLAIVHGSGDFIEHQLRRGETFLVSTGNLAVFSGEVQYNIRRTGGCLKSLFGGEGIFMTEMTGPGWVMLQSLKKLPAVKTQ